MRRANSYRAQKTPGAIHTRLDRGRFGGISGLRLVLEKQCRITVYFLIGRDFIEGGLEGRFDIGRKFLRVCKMVVMIARVLAPASDWEPKLSLRVMTRGRNSRSAKLFSAGISGSSTR